MNRRRQALERSERELKRVESAKRELDYQLQDELRRYDSAFIESIREVDRKIATLEERLLLQAVQRRAPLQTLLCQIHRR